MKQIFSFFLERCLSNYLNNYPMPHTSESELRRFVEYVKDLLSKDV